MTAREDDHVGGRPEQQRGAGGAGAELRGEPGQQHSDDDGGNLYGGVTGDHIHTSAGSEKSNLVGYR